MESKLQENLHEMQAESTARKLYLWGAGNILNHSIDFLKCNFRIEGIIDKGVMQMVGDCLIFPCMHLIYWTRWIEIERCSASLAFMYGRSRTGFASRDFTTFMTSFMSIAIPCISSILRSILKDCLRFIY